ncbi:lysophospholipid acyltransferase family protein [Galbitalea sp. SE-J8]|nr:lysophospholipid acyltransferase family protein [Galbitalea sp. SE-J8]MDM4763714.1 lysophospholipid acyltransferase family protein [Galbitalea sp. SE-J8]
MLVPTLRVLMRQEVAGAANVPAGGAFVLAPNHTTNLDPVTMGLALWDIGRPPHFLAKESLFRVPVLGALMRATSQVPVARAGGGRGPDPVRAAREIARRGGSVIVYPEGSLTRDPALWPMRGKTGAVRIALEAGIPLVPAVHWGDQEILPTYGRPRLWPPRRRVRIVFGDPVDLSPWRDGPVDQAALRAGTDLLMASIAALLAGLRGEAAPVERWDPAAHGQSEIGRIDP